MKFRQHIPGFVSGFKAIRFSVKNTDLLLKTDVFKSFSEHDNFYRFSFTENYHNEEYPEIEYNVIAELNGGNDWWVVGTIDEKPELPEWNPPPYRKKLKPKGKTVTINFDCSRFNNIVGKHYEQCKGEGK